MMRMPVVHFDCRHFRGDLPCTPNKERGKHCHDCNEYEKRGPRVLIIKLDAMGDVLRTTCVIEPVLRTWPNADITWITAPASVPMLKGIPGIAEVVPQHHQAIALLSTTAFDVVLGLDPSPECGRLVELSRSPDKRGFGLRAPGVVGPLNSGAEEWFTLGLFDDLKAKNTRTYQDLICQAASLTGPPGKILFGLSAEERAEVPTLRDGLGVRSASVIGLNTGSGGRWPNKRWPTERWRELIALILSSSDAQVLLLGGPDEREEQPRLREGFDARRVLSAGCDNPIRRFGQIVSMCTGLVTGDTLGLHLSLALGIPTVALFGPTSSHEIEMYALGTRLAPQDCACFYRKTCTRPVPCLATISANQVHRELAALTHPS